MYQAFLAQADWDKQNQSQVRYGLKNLLIQKRQVCKKMVWQVVLVALNATSCRLCTVVETNLPCSKNLSFYASQRHTHLYANWYKSQQPDNKSLTPCGILTFALLPLRGTLVSVNCTKTKISWHSKRTVLHQMTANTIDRNTYWQVMMAIEF